MSEIVLALGSLEQPFPAATESWCDAGDIADMVSCPPNWLDVNSVCSVASRILYRLSGRRYGVRRGVVRPHRIVDPGMASWGVSPYPTGGFPLPDGPWSFCDAPLEGIILPPRSRILAISIDGVPLDPAYADGVTTSASTTFTSATAAFGASDVGRGITATGIPSGATIVSVTNATTVILSAAATATQSGLPFTIIGRTPGYALYDQSLLVRAGSTVGRTTWPYYQRLDLPLGSVGTWGITLEQGTPVPDDAKFMARQLAADLVRQVVATGACGPPERVTQVNRQGIQYQVLDPSLIYSSGKTGVRLVDLWLSSVNPSGLRRRARIASPETIVEART